jgi:mono/diheme cytochrome c family protein
MKHAPAPGMVLGLLAMASAGIAAAAQDRQRSAPELFAATCVYCHDTGGWGTRTLARRVPEGQAELLQRKDLPPQLTRFVVRHGIGSMPTLAPTDLTDEELDRLARWLEDNN